jgi:protease I
MSTKLQGRKIAMVATDGFQQVELTEPQKAFGGEGSIRFRHTQCRRSLGR